MKIGFTGTRKGMTMRQKTTLTFILTEHDWFVHGGCRGADTDADFIAETILGSDKVMIRPGDEDQYRYWSRKKRNNLFSPRPYLERNKEIVDDSDVLIAAPSSLIEEVRSGTWTAIRYARKEGVGVLILDP